MLSDSMKPGRDPEGTDAPVTARTARLDSWKEIAAYLRRGVRTVQRWECEEGLPVHRLAHVKRGTVYADREELAAWWRRREQEPPRLLEQRRPPSPPERLTSTCTGISYPALSSDARLIAYVSDSGNEGEPPQVWIQQVGGAAMRLTYGMRDCAWPAFSADSTRIVFTATGESGRSVYEVPALGGSPRPLRRAAKAARFSPDGRWLAYISLDSPGGIRLNDPDRKSDRAFAQNLMDVACFCWSPDSRFLLVFGRPDPSVEPDFWIVPVAGGAAVDSGILAAVRPGFKPLECAPAWVGGHIVFSAATRDGVCLWRQRIRADTFQPVGDPERLTHGADVACFPTAAAGRLAFVGARHDMNLWSVAVDGSSGMPYGSLRRLTRGPGILSHLSLTRDGRMLAYFTTRRGKPEVFLRDLENGSETEVPGDAGVGGPGFPTISPSGAQLAYGSLVPGPPVKRPISIVDLRQGATREVCEDCGGRPRQWLDERHLLVETFGSGPNRIVVLDTVTASQTGLLASHERSLSNPSVSPDGRWIAFDARRPGGLQSVYIAPTAMDPAASESDWIPLDQGSSHPFWSRDGRLVYFLAARPNSDIRGLMRARGFDPSSGRPRGESMDVLSFSEMAVLTLIPGTTPIVAPDQMIFVLGDFRGDLWMMNL